METLNKHYIEGQEKAKQRNYAAAVDKYNLAIELQPQNADIYSDRAVAYFHLKKLNLSLMDMNKAQKLDPKNAYRYSSRAYIKDACGDIEGAIADYRKTIEIDPDDAIAFNNLGLLEEKQGRQTVAKNHFKKADELADKLGLNFGELSQPTTQTETEDKATKIEPAAEEEKSNLMRESVKVFTDKATFREFIRFVKNGFK